MITINSLKGPSAYFQSFYASASSRKTAHFPGRRCSPVAKSTTKRRRKAGPSGVYGFRVNAGVMQGSGLVVEGEGAIQNAI